MAYSIRLITKTRRIDMYENHIQNAIDEQACSSFPNPERTASGEAETLIIKRNRRRTETILVEMIDKSRQKKISQLKQKDRKKNRRRRRRGTKIYVVADYL